MACEHMIKSLVVFGVVAWFCVNKAISSVNKCFCVGVHFICPIALMSVDSV